MSDKNLLLRSLQDIGLRESEARVYLAALSLGPTTPLLIARSSGLKRTTVYEILDGLIEQGFMRLDEQGLKRYYVAEEPARLEALLRRRRETFRELLPQFEALHRLKGNESVIKYYESTEALKNEYEDLLNRLKSGDEYYVYGDPTRYAVTEKEFFKEYIQHRLRIPIDARLILTDNDLAREYKRFEANYNEKVRILPIGVTLDVNVTMTKYKIIIHQLVEPVLTIVIENRSLIDMQMTLFRIMWEKLPQ